MKVDKSSNRLTPCQLRPNYHSNTPEKVSFLLRIFFKIHSLRETEGQCQHWCTISFLPKNPIKRKQSHKLHRKNPQWKCFKKIHEKKIFVQIHPRIIKFDIYPKKIFHQIYKRSQWVHRKIKLHKVRIFIQTDNFITSHTTSMNNRVTLNYMR